MRGKYVIIKGSLTLGEGGQGKVYLGYFVKDGKLDLERPIAIKESNIPSPDLLRNADEQNKIKEKINMSINEVIKMREFDNIHIVKFIDTFRTRETLYLVMEYCNKRNLLEYLRRRGKLSEPEAIYCFAQLIEAFRYLYYNKNKTLHRDIKPDNILVHKENDLIILKLVDCKLN